MLSLQLSLQIGLNPKAENEEKEYPDPYNQEDHVLKKSLREIIDNGVSGRVKDPIVVGKGQVVEEDKGPVKEKDQGEAQKEGEDQGESEGPGKEAEVSFFVSSDSNNQGEEEAGQAGPKDDLEDDPDLGKVGEGRPGLGQAPEGQPIMAGVQTVADEALVVFLDDGFGQGMGIDFLFGKKRVGPGLGHGQDQSKGK